MNILFVCEHISTGGMPQYLLYCVKKLKEAKNQVSAVVYKDIAPAYRVQKDRLSGVIPESFFMLQGGDGDKPQELKGIIEKVNPDIVHLQEFPEISLPQEAIDVIYASGRKYKIVETSHDSGFRPENKRTRPDGFAFISNFHPQLYKNFGIPWRIVEYPVEYHDRPNRDEAFRKLNANLDPKLFHVLNVGLFTPRKNQREIFEIARKMPNVQFHFVGNQAGNFEFYWKPLMQNKPDNCIIWGESSYVDLFYSAMDAFLFASKGTVTDLETNPIVLREAIGWRMPVLMRNLPVYGDMFSKYDQIYYIDDDLDKTCEILEMVLTKKSLPDYLRLQGPYSPSVPIQLEVQTRLDDSREHTRVHFISNKNLKVIAALYDYKLDYFLYEAEMNLTANCEYWLQMNARRVDLTGVTLRLLEKLGGKVLFEKSFDFGNRFDNIIFNKNVKMSAPSGKRSWYAYYETLMKRTYEHRSVAVNEGDICLDLGAHVGFATFYCLDCGASKVYSVEPDPELFSCMKKNVEGFPVIPIHAAMTDKTSEADFNVYLDTYNCSALNEIGNIHRDAKFQVVRVPTLSLEDLIKKYNIEKIDFLKVDVEGSEYDVFFNADKEYLKNNISKIAMETHIVDSERDMPKKEKLIQLFKDCGFHVELVNPDSVNTMLYVWKEDLI